MGVRPKSEKLYEQCSRPSHFSRATESGDRGGERGQRFLSRVKSSKEKLEVLDRWEMWWSSNNLFFFFSYKKEAP